MALITDKQQLFMVGKGKDGQLGRAFEIESIASNKTLPKIVEYFFKHRVLKV